MRPTLSSGLIYFKDSSSYDPATLRVWRLLLHSHAWLFTSQSQWTSWSWMSLKILLTNYLINFLFSLIQVFIRNARRLQPSKGWQQLSSQKDLARRTTWYEKNWQKPNEKKHLIFFELLTKIQRFLFGWEWQLF